MKVIDKTILLSLNRQDIEVLKYALERVQYDYEQESSDSETKEQRIQARINLGICNKLQRSL